LTSVPNISHYNSVHFLSYAGFRFHVRYARTRIDLQGNARSNILILTDDIDNRLGSVLNYTLTGVLNVRWW
jgi:hypothetical protein